MLKKLKQLKWNKEGLTLLEVLLSFTILAIIFASVTPFLIQAVRNNKMVETSHQSIYFAKEKLTEIQSSNGIKNFLTNLIYTPADYLLKSNEDYADLHLLSDIQMVQLQEKMTESDPIINKAYYLLEIKDEKLLMKIYIRAEADYLGSPLLYRTIISIYDENNKFLTKSFGYIKY